MSENIFINAKLRPRPGPDKYENNNTMLNKMSKKSKIMDKETKCCGFIEQSIKFSQDVPGDKYNRTYNTIHPKIRKPYIAKESEKTAIIDNRINKIQLNKDAPDFYEL